MKLNRWRWVWLILFAGGLILSTTADARIDYDFDSYARNQGQYEDEMAQKFTRGLTNIIFGWTEIGVTPVRWAYPPDRGAISATLIGVPYGILRFLGRTGVGVYEVLTAYAPQKPIFAPIEGEIL